MGQIVLSLGDVSFRDMEVPEAINFGGSQRLAIQNVVGGGRIVEAMGLDDGEISFSGIFSGSDATARAQLLDTARALGAQLPLIWQDFYYLVIIARFNAEYRKPNLIPFSITCAVVTDPLAATANAVAPLANLIGGDLALAATLSGQAGLSASTLSGMSLSALSLAQASIADSINESGTALRSAAIDLNTAFSPTAGVNALARLGASASQLAALTGMSGFINRAAANMMLGG